MASTTGINVSQLGSLYGLSATTVKSIPARVDELFRHFPALLADRGVGRMVEATDTDVLLETVA
jgi:hypothetical protein